MGNSVNWQAVFFDFDGVIVDSVGVKTEAFARLFRKYGPAIEKQVVAYHLAHGGVSRFAKFRYFYEKLLHIPVSDEQLEGLGAAFSDLVVTGVLDAPFIPGALDSLKRLHRQGVLAFVVSGTPQEELGHIVEVRGLAPWFTEVHGSPRLKHDMIRGIQGAYTLEPSACLMVGDAMTDLQAAVATDSRFLGIVASHHVSPFPPGTPVSSTVFIP